ncbi:PREDICTED: Golgi integral membrane protein 4-like isoform X3 [Eufriesea mexicana]|uniref:Golgi integral membrane protein 4-like isoform X3 n=1 Tax=Eufriesea mexicana TaxID=516756 RepID=UPI00083BF015|nr:PREDICTED: Golgi integral membrane protein 4-like isoform X3 [Eufriesea mexicana]
MSSSRLGRGRGGRLAVYGGCGVVVLLLVFLYRAATSEMARLRELNVQCAHQQEALAAQLQVIFEYKVRLEKSLSEEKSSNAAVKQELQQRASREKTLRDKDSIEAMQRFNSLQQTCKLLQIEHQDLQEECKKRDQQALEDTNKLETTLRELRSRIRQAREDKKKTLEDLKNKFLELDTKKNELEQKYNSMLKNNSIEYLKTEVIHLKQELEKAKKSLRKATSPGPSVVNPQAAPQTKSADLGSAAQPVDQSQQQQSTVATSSMKSIPALKLETSTPASSGNPASMAMDKGFPIGKPAPKAKLPVGVPPIPIMIDQKVENHEEKQDEIARKREEPKQKNNGDSKEQEAENGNLDPPFPANPARRADDQVADRRGNGWFNVGPGVQEIGDELNHIRLAGLDVGAERIADAGDDQYEGVEYDKEPQQKDSDLRLVEGEDEGEDEDDQIDYPHNLKQEKRE